MTPSIENMMKQGLKPGDTVKLRIRDEGAVSRPPTSVIGEIFGDFIDSRTGRTKVLPANYPSYMVFEGIDEKGQAVLSTSEGDPEGFSTTISPKLDKFEGFEPSEKTTSQ